VKVALPKTGPGVEAPPLLRAVVLVDLLLAAVVLVLAGVTFARGDGAPLPLSPSEAAWVGAYALVVVLADVAAGRLSPAGLTWRRRLGYLGMGAAVWRGGLLHEHREAAALVVLYLGVVWVGLVTGGRALSRAIASATGEDKPE
jgi:hypothetical protein